MALVDVFLETSVWLEETDVRLEELKAGVILLSLLLIVLVVVGAET